MASSVRSFKGMTIMRWRSTFRVEIILSRVETNQGLCLVYIHVGRTPFQVINQAVKLVVETLTNQLLRFQESTFLKFGSYLMWHHVFSSCEKHLQTFNLREKKKLPSFVDWFGWCTWDAFYTDVTAEGVEEGLKSLASGGTLPRFLVVDDGWQQIGNEVQMTQIVLFKERNLQAG